MAKYRVTLADRVGVPHGTLRLAGADGSPLTFSNVINGGGDGTLAVKYDQPLISGLYRGRLSAWASEILVERLSGFGQTGIVAAGPVTKPAGNLDSEQLTVTFASLFSWLGERLITQRLVYAGVEQTEIAGDLIVKHTSDLGDVGDIRLGFKHLQTGVRVSQQYLPADQRTPAEAITTLATAKNGFDFDVVLGRSRGRITRVFTPYFPQKGRRVSQVLTPGKGGLRGFTIEEATEIATRVTGTGQATITKAAPASVEQRYGIHQRSLSLTDANSIDKLTRQVLDYLQSHMPPVNIVSFGYRVSPATPFRFVEIGDSVRVKAGRGWMEFDGWVRIVGESVAVDSAGNEDVTLTAAEVADGIS